MDESFLRECSLFMGCCFFVGRGLGGGEIIGEGKVWCLFLINYRSFCTITNVMKEKLFNCLTNIVHTKFIQGGHKRFWSFLGRSCKFCCC